MKVQIVGFEGYDNDLGGVTATVLVNGEKHTITIQCCVTEDGEYAENDHDNLEDNRWFIDGLDVEELGNCVMRPNSPCYKTCKNLFEKFGDWGNIRSLIRAVNNDIIHWDYAPDIATETIDVYSNVERSYMNPFDMVYAYDIEKIDDDDFKINKEKQACEDHVYCSRSDGSEYRVPMKKSLKNIMMKLWECSMRKRQRKPTSRKRLTAGLLTWRRRTNHGEDGFCKVHGKDDGVPETEERSDGSDCIHREQFSRSV